MNEILRERADLSPAEPRLMQEGTAASHSAGERIPRLPHGQRAQTELSFAQQRLWFVEQLAAGTALHHVVAAYRVTGQLDVAALEQSVAYVVARHETLRTTFAAVAGAPVQVVATTAVVPVTIVDAADEAAVLRAAQQDARRPFDLKRGPLLRVTVVRIAEADQLVVVVLHHLIADGWSAGLLAQELSAGYRAARTKQPPALPALPIQYSDFAMWQRTPLQRAALAAQLAYWRQQLRGAPPMLDLPADRPRPVVQTFRGARQAFRIDGAVAAGLRALSRRERVTLFMTLLAAFTVLLERYTGETDLVVGTPIANRTRWELEPLIGCFANTLALRSNLAGDPTFRTLLGQVRTVCLEAYAHQDVPFERLVEELHPERDLSRTPLIQVLLQLQNTPREPLDLPDLTLRRVALDTGAAALDLSVMLAETPDGLMGVAEYSTDLFEAPTIRRLLGHYEQVLRGVVADSDARLSALPLLTLAETQVLTVDRNSTAAPIAPLRINELFELQTTKTPDAIAVVFDDERLTYDALNRRANQLAHYIRARGVGPEDHVAVCLERSADLLVTLLAVLKSGAAYVPLDPSYPSNRLAFMLGDSCARLLVRGPSTPDIPGCTCPVVDLIRETDDISTRSAENPARTIDHEGLAYVIYTSGSTGQPKGVQVCHAALANLIDFFTHCLDVNRSDAFFSLTSISFDVAALELYLPLAVGARVVLAGRGVAGDGHAVAALLSREQISVFGATPATWRLLLDTGWSGDHHLTALCGGEALSIALAQQLVGRHASVWNLYGPTETTVWSTASQLAPDAQTVTLGAPIDNTEVYVLDRLSRLVPALVPGELQIGGVGVARGYWNRPGLTAERFVPDALSGRPGARLYCTGDIVRRRTNGELEFCGRVDHQIKIRGHRIELGEIESALRASDKLRDAVVISETDEAGDARLIAYVTVEGDAAPAREELWSHLRGVLPDFMIPNDIIRLGELPLSANGKIDRAALPRPRNTPIVANKLERPRTEIQKDIARIWQEVLAVPEVGLNDGFFQLGGNSFLLIQTLERFRSELMLPVSLTDLFRYPTLRSLTEYLDGLNMQALDDRPIDARAAKQRETRQRAKRVAANRAR